MQRRRLGTSFGLLSEIAPESEFLRFRIQVFREPRPTNALTLPRLEPEEMALLLGRSAWSSWLSLEDIEDAVTLWLLLLSLLGSPLSDRALTIRFRSDIRFCFGSRRSPDLIVTIIVRLMRIRLVGIRSRLQFLLLCRIDGIEHLKIADRRRQRFQPRIIPVVESKDFLEDGRSHRS